MGRSDPRSHVLPAGWPGAALAAVLALVPGAASTAQEAATPAVVGQAASQKRALTLGELQRAIDELQGRIEDLHERAEGRALTEAEQEDLARLQSQLDDLLAQQKAAESQARAQATRDGDTLLGRWRRTRLAFQDMTRFDIKDGMFRIGIGVRFQVDGTVADADSDLETHVGTLDDSVELRRGQVFARGRLFRTLDFRFDYDLGADDGLKDMYLDGIRYTRYVRWRIGHFKEPFSLSRQVSSNDLGLMEWPLPVQAFAPGRNWGLMLRHAELDERMTWALSVTTNGKNTDDNRNNASLTGTGRLTGLPLYRDGGRHLVHLGLGYSERAAAGDKQRFGARPEARFLPFFVDTGDLAAHSGQLLGLEAATVQGPVWLQGEWIAAWSDTDSLGRLRFEGSYVEAGWFLTGESRFYDTQNGVFGRLTPSKRFHGGNPFTGKGDGGALEVTGRVSAIDLDDGPVQGGRMTDLSVGLNWYPTAATRLMLNYIRSDVRDVGPANIVLLRYQFNP